MNDEGVHVLPTVVIGIRSSGLILYAVVEQSCVSFVLSFCIQSKLDNPSFRIRILSGRNY
jgi:hypothetical protein